VPMKILKRIWIPDDTAKGGKASEISDSSTACVVVTPNRSCKRVIQGSGTFKFVALVNGVQMEASVHVNAIPCPTGNVILDHKEVRTGLVNMFKASNADSLPGSGRGSWCRDANGNPVSNCGHKNEQGVFFVKRPNGSYYTVPVPATYRDECTIRYIWPPQVQLPAGDTVVAVAHSHPASGAYQERVYCRLKGGSGRWSQLFPGDTVDRAQIHALIELLNGGGSAGDWLAADTTNVDQYTMTKDDEVYQLPPHYTGPKSSIQSRRWVWRGNLNPACDF
jgi:hypothetical protein